MSRAVFLPGFGAGEAVVGRVAWGLQAFHSNVEAFSFSDTMKMKEDGSLSKLLKGAVAYAHSGGAVAAEGESPAEMHWFNAPYPPGSKIGLIGKTATKTMRMHTPGMGIKSIGDLERALIFDASTVGEISMHPIANLKQLGKIARFNSIVSARDAIDSGIPTGLAYSSHDSYFRLSDADHALAEISGVPVHMFAGQHDEIVLRPYEVLNDYLNNANV